MSISNMHETSQKESILWKIALVALMGGVILIIVDVAGLLLGYSPAQVISKTADAVLATNSVHVTWYITRAAGLTAYLLLWLSTVWGLAVSSKIFDPVLHRIFTYDFHQFISLLAIGFTILHIVVLTVDQYLPFSIDQLLIPFTSTYRPLWTGIGVIALYLTLLVTITFYIRRWIGNKAFRVIHYASLIAFFGAALHGLFAGTDSPLWTTQAMYLGTTLTVAFLTAYWIFVIIQKRQVAA